MHPKIAALDLGSNSFHLALAECHGARHFHIAASWKEKVQLGKSVFANGSISESAFERGLDALRKLKRMLDTQRPDLTLAAATSALREAQNGADFVVQAARILGVPVRVLGGGEEARLMGLGTVQAMPTAKRRLAVFDLGGGSTEAVVIDHHGTQLATSLPLGTLRLQGEWGSLAKPSRAQLDLLARYVENLLAPTLERVVAARFDTLVLSCGSARDLARIAQRIGVEPSALRTPMVLSAAALDILEQRLAELAPEERAALAGSNPERADTLLVAASVFKTLLSRLGVEQAWVSSAGLREGMIADHLAQNQVARSALLVAL
jgi:exopolyphosphatase/guanosine-5'-triphosphate,3'-diphosphate pyrophosphatase